MSASQATISLLLALSALGCRGVLGIEDVSPAGDAGVDADPAFRDCALTPPCPTPDSDKLSVCGRIFDAVTAAPLALPGDAALCGGRSDGPCQLVVELFDLVEAVNGGPETIPLAVESTSIDTCGRFAATNINPPGSNFVVVAVSDGGIDYVVTGVSLPVEAGQAFTEQEAFAIRAMADEAWTASAGLAQSFSEIGAVLMSFEDVEIEPPRVPGVQPVASGADPADKFYFASDSDAHLNRTDPALTSTSSTGAALIINTSLVDHTGGGAERQGCDWETGIAASIDGAILVAPRRMVQLGTDTPCPP